MTKRKIILSLNHNYLSIEDSDSKEIMHVPIRCAKLIADMYDVRNAKDELKDLKHYSELNYQNAEYDISVILMNTKFDNELQWVSRTIKPFDIKK